MTGLVLPETACGLIGCVPVADRHPGLQLDKFSPPGDQKRQREAIDDVIAATGNAALLASMLRRRQEMLDALGARCWTAETAGALTLHLARASALENAGICLHPVYGFVYMPGSGLKGMARAYAETVWLPAQADRTAALAQIRAGFGWAVGSERDKGWLPDGAREPDDSRAGAVVFHDAWPTRWPRLAVDITNSHHAQYYQGKDRPPGDWEGPIPVYFLAVKPRTPFSFAVSARQGARDAAASVEQAALWLQGALCHAGAGAKTAAGYGSFRLVESAAPPAPAESLRPRFEAELRLVTPAFLAGAEQNKEDCDLRPATLRGLLRWWWRTMHAAHVDTKTLKALEAAVWGDVNAGGAVRIQLSPVSQKVAELYAFKDRFEPKPDFKRCYGLADRPDRKTTQGLFYASYGMDDGGNRRWIMPPGASWRVSLVARAARFPADADPKTARRLDAALVLEQAEAALWLFCRYGGAGSKSRKGFGSFADIDVRGIASAADCRAAAARFRAACGIAVAAGGTSETPALDGALFAEIPVPAANPWAALDLAGYGIQAFAQSLKHKPEKAALGLPRKIHGPREDGPIKTRDGHPVQDAKAWRPPEWLGEKHPYKEAGTKTKDMRHAAPVLYHLASREGDRFALRVTAFPSPVLPDLATSQRVLTDLIKHLETDLPTRAAPGRAPPAPPPRPPASARPSLPPAGTFVDAELVEEKTAKGGWKARHVESGIVGPIQNSADVPSDKKPGDTVRLLVANRTDFKWPTPQDEARAAKPKGPPPRRR